MKPILSQYVHKIVNKKKTRKKRKKCPEQNIFYFSFYIYCANFVRIGSQIKKFPKNWVGPLNSNNLIRSSYTAADLICSLR